MLKRENEGFKGDERACRQSESAEQREERLRRRRERARDRVRRAEGTLYLKQRLKAESKD